VIIAGLVLGLAHQLRMDPWIESHRFDPGCLAIDAEPFYKTTPLRLRWLAARCPLIVHCSSLSLGGPEPLDERELASCAAIVHTAKARWLSHALGFSRAGGIDLGLVVPISLTASALRLVADRVRQVMDRCGCPLALGNSSSPLRVRGSMAETDFLNELCARSGASLQVDLAALETSHLRYGLDVDAWLDAVDHRAVVEMRITVMPWDRDKQARRSFERQLAHADRLRLRTPDAAVVLGASLSCPVDGLDRAWSELTQIVPRGDASTVSPS